MICLRLLIRSTAVTNQMLFLRIDLYACATYSELPTNISTMPFPILNPIFSKYLFKKMVYRIHTEWTRIILKLYRRSSNISTFFSIKFAFELKKVKILLMAFIISIKHSRYVKKCFLLLTSIYYWSLLGKLFSEKNKSLINLF